MPNGRSDGFVINLSDLKQIIAASPDELVGRVNDNTGSRLLPVTAAQWAALLEGVRKTRVDVEEQDGTHYIIQLSHEPLLYILALPNSPLTAALRAFHMQWRREHS
jgi:hypothetical protein